MVFVVEGRVMIDGAIDRGGLRGMDICGIDVGVVDSTGRCETVGTSISVELINGFVRI